MKGNTGPIFIVGAPRSGTTMLQYMLRSHPRISVPTGETHFMIPLYRERASYGDLRDTVNIRGVLNEMYRRSANFLDTDLHGLRFDVDALASQMHADGVASMQEVFGWLLAKNAQGEGKVRWGEKTPYYVLHIPTIIEMYPDAKIIHIIRDGRDCACSMFVRQHDFGIYNSYAAAQYWQQYVEVGQAHGKQLSPNVYTELRYEELIRDPVTQMRRICGFLEEEYYDSVVNYKKSREKGKTPLLQEGVSKSNAEKWRSKMTIRQVRLFESEAGDTLRANGYPVQTSAKRLPLPIRALYSWHNRAVKRWRHRHP